MSTLILQRIAKKNYMAVLGYVTPNPKGNISKLKERTRKAAFLCYWRINEYVFAKANLNGHRWSYEKQRRKLSIKLQNPRLNEIKFHTLRHWFATREYAKTNVLLHVQERLGHRNINSTMVYTHLIKTEGDKYYSAIAKTTEEALRLIEDGFNFICITAENKCFLENPNSRWVSTWAWCVGCNPP